MYGWLRIGVRQIGRSTITALLLSLSLGLSACGGGGSSSGDGDPGVGAANPGGGGGATNDGSDQDSPGTTPPPTANDNPDEPALPLNAAYGFQRQMYIDPALSRDCVGQYNHVTGACGSGGSTAFRSIDAIATNARPGDQFLFRGGVYRQPLRLTTSGNAAAYIGFASYPGEVATFDANSTDGGSEFGPIWFDGVSYNVIERVRVTGSVGFVRAVDAHYNVIDSSTFDTSDLYPSESKRGGLYFYLSTHNKITNNRIIRGTDSVALVRSDFNVVADNVFELAGHDIWNIKCGSYNVIRNNLATNPSDKLGSVFDCESATVSWVGNGALGQTAPILDATKRNLIEGNLHDTSSEWYSTSGGNGIQYAGQEGIIRNNVFVRANVGIGMTQYEEEAQYNYGNRVYHNVFYDNRCGGVATQGDRGQIGRVADNVYVNNILWDNKGWAEGGNCGGVSAAQVIYRHSLDGHQFRGNLLASPQGDAVVRREFGEELTLADLSGSGSFVDSIEADPQFVNAPANDFQLSATSPAVDAGVPLTTIVSPSGTGDQLRLADASFFYDGYGIRDEVGDLVQLSGTTDAVRISNIDYETNQVTLEQAITWQQGQGIGLAFSGNAPDMGIIER